MTRPQQYVSISPRLSARRAPIRDRQPGGLFDVPCRARLSAPRAPDPRRVSSLLGAGQLRRRLHSPHPLLGAVAALFFLASPSFAGGLADTADAPDPCPAFVPVNDGSMSADMFRQWIAVRSMSCPDEPVRTFFDAKTGLRLTDDELARRIFNGSTVDGPAPVPLPGSLALLVAALGMLAWRRG